MPGWDDAPTPVLKTPMGGGSKRFRRHRFRSPPIPEQLCSLCVFAWLELRLMHVTMAPVARASLRALQSVPVDEGHLRPGDSSPEPLAWRAHEALQHRNMR